MLCTALLLITGLIVLFAASYYNAQDKGSALSEVWSQLLGVAVGVCGMAVVLRLDYQLLKKPWVSGGLVGINFFDEFVLSDSGDYMTALLKHIEHFLSLGGERCVCIGSDYDGAQINECLDSLDKLPRLWEALQKIGYGDALIDRIFYQNAADFFEREGK